LAALIPKGMQAFTIPTFTVASGTAGLILPRDKVDVLLTGEEPAKGVQGNEPPPATILAEDVEILAVDQHLDTSPVDDKIGSGAFFQGKERSVTVLVKPHQAAILARAIDPSGGSKRIIQLALRNPHDQLYREPTAAKTSKPQLRTYKLRIRTLRGDSEGSVFVGNVSGPGKEEHPTPPVDPALTRQN
jgi:Flp pilus assembly protein CpaB